MKNIGKKEKEMKPLRLRKALTLVALLVLIGQIMIPTIDVLSAVLPQTEESSQRDTVNDQTESTLETEEVSQDSEEESSDLSSSTESSETNQSNAPPVEETNQSSETKEVSDSPIDTSTNESHADDIGSLTTDASGNIYYNGEMLFFEDGKVPANMEELFKKGIPTELQTKSSVGTANIQYLGAVTWGYHTVGNFTVNGKQAFCLEHPKGTPPTGTPNNGLEPYDNKAIAAVLYWGWAGPKNIFSDKNAGIVATSLALSHFYYGDSYNSLPSGYDTLIAKGKAGDVPDHSIYINHSHNLVNLPVTYNKTTGIQKSATATLNADSTNAISFAIPSGIKFVNETTGKTATSGTVTVYGGQKYHFEADAKTAATITATNLKGTMQAFQPLVVKPVSSGLQTIGTWRWYEDETQRVSFKAIFVKRNGNAQLTKVDADTGQVLKGAKFEYTIDGVTKTATTDSNGLITINDVLDGKKVTIKEVTAPTGYVLNDTPQTVTIKAGETVKVKFTNKKIMGSVKLLKYADEDWTTGKKEIVLPGAEFTLFKSDGKTKVQTQTTNSNGEVHFKAIEYGFGYIIRETKTPEGYEPVADMVVDITQDGKVIELTAIDQVIHEDLKLIKYDEESTSAILSQDAKFEITNLQTNLKVTHKDDLGQDTTVFVTNEAGEILLPNLPYGKYRLSEIKAPFGYLQLSQPVDFFINGKNNGVLTVKIGNKVVKGRVEMTKSGEKTTTVDTEETEYGTLYHYNVTQEALEGVTFDIFARKDIVTGDGKLQAKAGDLVGTYTTDKDGKFTSDELYIGSYYAKEKSAPNGYVVKTDEIDFTINYEGELVPITSSSIKAENNWNEAKVIIHKVDETLIGYEDNAIQTEEVESNGKTFGLFKTERYVYNEVELSPDDALVGVAATEDGKAVFDGKYPNGAYYAMELDAGNSHVINKTKYPVELTPTDNREQLESHVYDDTTFFNDDAFNRMARNPIVNKLFKTTVPFEKFNETTRLESEVGYVYEFDQLGEGTEYELSNAEGDVIQQLVIGKDGKGYWTDLVVGNYTFKETKTTYDYLVIDETIYNISVTQEKTVITDTKDGSIVIEIDNTEEVKKQSEAVTRPGNAVDEEGTEDGTKTNRTSETTDESADSTEEESVKEDVKEPVMTFKNKAVRGKSVLKKTDVSDGKKLADAGIELKDETGKIVAKGVTDSNGVIEFENLPKGKYTFTEYQAPDGYVIDKTPIPFEIKEDGEVVTSQMTNVKETDKLRQTKARKDSFVLVVVLTTAIMGVVLILYARVDESLY